MKKIFILLFTLLLISGCFKESNLIKTSNEEIEIKGCWNLFASELYKNDELYVTNKTFTKTTIKITDDEVLLCRPIDSKIECRPYGYSFKDKILKFTNLDEIIYLKKYGVTFEKGLFNNFMKWEGYNQNDYFYLHFNSIPCE